VRVEKKLKADLVNIRKSVDPESKEKTTTLVIRTKVLETEAAKVFGEALHTAAFASRTDRDGTMKWLVKSSKPSIGFEKHMVKLLGHGPFPSLPRLAKISAGTDTGHVLLDIHLPITVSKKAAGELWDAQGETVDVEMYPTNGDLFAAASAEKAKDEKKAVRKRK